MIEGRGSLRLVAMDMRMAYFPGRAAGEPLTLFLCSGYGTFAVAKNS
jgi:hypothetical protein